MRWTIEFHPLAVEEASQQPLDIRARIERLCTLIALHGPAQLPPKAARHLRGELWELRVTGRDGIARALYVTRRERRLVIVRVFAKKTQKTPPREMEIAMDRAGEIG